MTSNPSLILMAVTFVCGILIGGSGVFLFMLRMDRRNDGAKRATKRVADLDDMIDRATTMPGSHRREARKRKDGK